MTNMNSIKNNNNSVMIRINREIDDSFTRFQQAREDYLKTLEEAQRVLQAEIASVGKREESQAPQAVSHEEETVERAARREHPAPIRSKDAEVIRSFYGGHPEGKATLRDIEAATGIPYHRVRSVMTRIGVPVNKDRRNVRYKLTF